jgi:hypothetical protein
MQPTLSHTGTTATTASGPFIQPKLLVNEPGDVYEQEADRVADQVMQTGTPFFTPPPVTTSTGAAGMIQRDVVDMPPMTITARTRGVEDTFSDLSGLRGAGAGAGGITMARGEEAVALNSPDPTAALPYTTSGWNGQEILTRLGQYDTLPGTDSDAVRCVQAVAMASYIPEGPQAVADFIGSIALEGLLVGGSTTRGRQALQVLDHVKDRITDRRATYADLHWAQEAMHDIFYDDVSGTPSSEIRSRIVTPMDFNRNMQAMNVWCNNPAEVMAQANALQNGEQLVVTTWNVVFNSAFDQLEEEGVATSDNMVVSVNGRQRRMRRLDTTTRPDHSRIDLVRDHQGGHQLLLLKDSATGQLRLYEPEVTNTGQHLEDLAADGSNFTSYFNDLPDMGIYNYIEILGKITPRQSSDFDLSGTYHPSEL